mgnify:FL=1
MAILSIVHGGAWAQTSEPESLGSFKDWSAFKLNDANGVVCFALASPEEMLPKNVSHGEVFFLVSNWVTRNVEGEPSLVTGYSFKEKSDVTVEIGSSKWQMFTDAQRAWVRDRDDEAALLDAMRAGSAMRVKGTSARGTATEYRISLSGISAALDRINSDCN